MKKTMLIALVMTIVLSLSATVNAFPEPDWGALLQERKEMVTETDFELYFEGDCDSGVYCGAKFEPKRGAILGSIPENSNNLMPLASYLTYIQEMDQDDFYYPANIFIREDDAMVMVGWTITDLDGVDYNQVEKVLKKLSSYKKPMFIRFANEMNESDMGLDPNKYIDVFRRVSDMVHKYDNFAVVWSPIDIGALDRDFSMYYPGDEYVDWVGISCYSIKYFQNKENTDEKSSTYFMAGDYAWATNRVKPILKFMRENGINKPLMLSEGGVATGNIYGEDLEAWATPRLGNMLWNVVMKYPEIKLINYFNNYRKNETEHFNISEYSYATEIFNNAKNSGAYYTATSSNAKFSFKAATDSAKSVIKDGVVNLYTLAYFPKKENITVNYHIDNEWYHSANTIPYICKLDAAKLSDGEHRVRIESEGMKKEYTFTKQNGNIYFGDCPDEVSNEISVYVNGEKVCFDVQPTIIDGRTLVPLRAIFEALGATVNWHDDTKTVVSEKNGTRVELTIDRDIMKVNDIEKWLDVPAMIIDGRTLVPVRAISESFGCSVGWDGETKTVYITE